MAQLLAPGRRPTSLSGAAAGLEDPVVLRQQAAEPTHTEPPTLGLPGGAAGGPSSPTAMADPKQGYMGGVRSTTSARDLTEKRLSTLILDYTADSHIQTVDPGVCRDKCQRHPCIEFCPAHVFGWHDRTGLAIQYEKCVECAACAIGCPEQNILLDYPGDGHGVTFRY